MMIQVEQNATHSRTRGRKTKKIPRPNAFADTTKARATRTIKSTIFLIVSVMEQFNDLLNVVAFKIHYHCMTRS